MFTDSTCPDSTCKYRNRLGYCTVAVCVAVSKPVSIREKTKTRTIEAVPLDKLCEWLTANRVSIPCRLCEYDDAGECTVQNDMSKPCPNTTRDWRRVITKWMEEQDAQKEN